MSQPMSTVVAGTVNCEIVLDSHGFYARCLHCPYVSEYTPAKHIARRWADAHDEGQADDGRAG